MATSSASAKYAPIARKMKEIILEVEDTRGKLADVFNLLAQNNVNLLAYTALHLGNVGVLHLITDKASLASRILEQTGAIRIGTSDIVFAVAKDKRGVGAELTRKIAEAGIDIHYSYATSGGGRNFGIAFQTGNNTRTVRVLNS